MKELNVYENKVVLVQQIHLKSKGLSAPMSCGHTGYSTEAPNMGKEKEKHFRKVKGHFWISGCLMDSWVRGQMVKKGQSTLVGYRKNVKQKLTRGAALKHSATSTPVGGRNVAPAGQLTGQSSAKLLASSRTCQRYYKLREATYVMYALYLLSVFGDW